VLRTQVPVSVVVCGLEQLPAVQEKRVTVRVRLPVSAQVLGKLQALQAP
jgi:hypothetical protein